MRSAKRCARWNSKILERRGKRCGRHRSLPTRCGEQVAKLYDRERGSATCIGQKFTVTLEITEKKGGSETTQTYTIPLPKNMDGIIINLPAYLAGLGEDAYLTEFIPSPDAEIVEEDTPSGDDFGMDDMTMDEVPAG